MTKIFRVASFIASLAVAGAAGATPGMPRIVSLSPHITELLFAAGAGERIVGVDDSSDFPAAAALLPKLGEPTALDVEALVRLSPTVVIVWGGGTPPGILAQLARLHIPLVVTEQHSLDDIGLALLEFGRLASDPAVAQEAARRYRTGLAELRRHYAGRRHLKVFYQVWERPLYTLSGAHIVSEVLTLCGGENIFAELATPAPLVDLEAVLADDPDVVLIAAGGPDGALQAADWGRFPRLAAVRHHSVFTVNPSLLGRMAPRMLDGVREVCEDLDRAREHTDRLQ